MNLHDDEDLRHLVKSISWKLYLFEDSKENGEYYKATWDEFRNTDKYQYLETIVYET